VWAHKGLHPSPSIQTWGCPAQRGGVRGCHLGRTEAEGPPTSAPSTSPFPSLISTPAAHPPSKPGIQLPPLGFAVSWHPLASQSGSHFDNKKGHWTLGASKGKLGSWRPDTYRPPLTSTQLCFLRRTEVPGRQGWSLLVGGAGGSRTEGSWAQPPLSPHGPWWLRSGLGEPLGWGWG